MVVGAYVCGMSYLLYVGLPFQTGGFLHNRGITESRLYIFASDFSGESSVHNAWEKGGGEVDQSAYRIACQHG